MNGFSLRSNILFAGFGEREGAELGGMEDGSVAIAIRRGNEKNSNLARLIYPKAEK